MLLLWQLSPLVSIAASLAVIAKKSWVFLLISTITFIPIAFCFSGAKSPWKYVGMTPVILLALIISIWFIRMKNAKSI